MLELDAASVSSFSLGRAVAPTLTPAAASRLTISPPIAPEAPVIHATFQGNCCSAMHAAQVSDCRGCNLSIGKHGLLNATIGARILGSWRHSAQCGLGSRRTAFIGVFSEVGCLRPPTTDEIHELVGDLENQVQQAGNLTACTPPEVVDIMS